MNKDYKNKYYPESKFGGFTDIDGTVTFYSRVHALLCDESVVLDVGCGRGACGDDEIPFRRSLRIVKGKGRRIVGIDVDEEASDNYFIDEFNLLKTADKCWPVDSGSIDLCLCDYVLEHVEDPEHLFSEVCRVLKTGGYFCLRTPNKYSYVGIISRLIPNIFHAKVLEKSQPERKEIDVFPTYYRCNSVWKIEHLMDKFNFEYCVYGYEAEPSYVSLSGFFYCLGVLYQRFAPGFIKSSIFAFARKK